MFEELSQSPFPRFARRQDLAAINTELATYRGCRCRKFADAWQLGYARLIICIDSAPPPGYHAPGVARFGAPDLIEVWMLELAVIR